MPISSYEYLILYPALIQNKSGKDCTIIISF